MFDGTLKTLLVEDAELARLRALYDGLLAPAGAEPDAAALTELAAMARIFDLETDRPAAEIWLELRAVLTRQTARAVANRSVRD